MCYFIFGGYLLICNNTIICKIECVVQVHAGVNKYFDLELCEYDSLDFYRWKQASLSMIQNFFLCRWGLLSESGHGNVLRSFYSSSLLKFFFKEDKLNPLLLTL